MVVCLIINILNGLLFSLVGIFGLFGAIIAYFLTKTLLKARNNNLDFEISLLKLFYAY